MALTILTRLEITNGRLVLSATNPVAMTNAKAAKSINPDIRIIGVESELSDSMLKSVEEGKIVPHTSGQSIAEGISVKYPGKIDLTELFDFPTIGELATHLEGKLAG